MAKLYFRYGVVSSAKTLNLLAVAHNYQLQGKRALILKPKLDTRFGEDIVASRAGLSMKADVLVEYAGAVPYKLDGVSCVLADEAQFLSSATIDRLHEVAHGQNVPVICYGLRTDFRRQLFEGSKRLMELADTIEEVKTTCFYCNKKATFNRRLVPGDAQIMLGGDGVYRPTCARHYEADV